MHTPLVARVSAGGRTAASPQAAVPNLVELDLRSNFLKELPRARPAPANPPRPGRRPPTPGRPGRARRASRRALPPPTRRRPPRHPPAFAAEFAELRTLKILRLNYNKLEAFPVQVVQLPRLQKLELSGNLISVIDPAISSMQGARPAPAPRSDQHARAPGSAAPHSCTRAPPPPPGRRSAEGPGPVRQPARRAPAVHLPVPVPLTCAPRRSRRTRRVLPLTSPPPHLARSADAREQPADGAAREHRGPALAGASLETRAHRLRPAPRRADLPAATGEAGHLHQQADHHPQERRQPGRAAQAGHEQQRARHAARLHRPHAGTRAPAAGLPALRAR